MELQSDPFHSIAEDLTQGPWDGPPVYVVVPEGAALRWEREILRRLPQAGSARLRVVSPGRAAATWLRALGLPAPEILSSGSLRAQVRLHAASGGTLLALSLPPQTAAGAERRLAQSVEELLWHAPSLVPETEGPLGHARYEALSALVAALVPEGASHVPESAVFWRAAAALRDGKPLGSVHWAYPQGSPALEALRDAIRSSGMPLTDWRSAPPSSAAAALSPGVQVQAFQCLDLAEEARAAVLRCRDLIAEGASPEEIAIGCADFGVQRPLLRGLLQAAHIPADLGPEPPEGQPLYECLAGLLELAAGVRGEEPLVRVVGSGLVPADAAQREAALRVLRDGAGRAGGPALPAALLPGADDWPLAAPFLAHLRHLDQWLRRLGLPQATAVLPPDAAAVQDGLWNAFWTLAETAALAADERDVPRDAALRAIGDLVRSAHPAYAPRRGAVRVAPLASLAGASSPHVLLLGLAEGSFPARAPQRGILPSQTLQAAALAGAPVGRNAGELRAEAERAAISVLCSASKTLWLSAASRDPEGRVQGYSALAEEVSAPRPFSVPDGGGGVMRTALSAEEAGIQIASAIAVRREIRADFSFLLPLSAAHLAAFGPGPHFAAFGPRRPEAPVGAMQEEIAVTALEQFAACAFRWLAQRLRLGAPQPQGEVDPRRRGSLVHRVLAELQYDRLSDEELAPAVRAAVEGAVALDPDLSVLRDEAGPKGRALREEMVLEILRTVRMLAAESRASAFRPVGRELEFGVGKALPALEVALPGEGTALLRGRIDRLEETEEFLRVTDFKVRGAAQFRFSSIYHGIDLQIGAYALAAERADGRRRAAAAAYWPVRLGVRSAPKDDDVPLEEMWKLYRQRGLFLGSPELVAAMDREHPSGPSPFHPLSVKVNGELSATSQAVPPSLWEGLERHVEKLLGELAAGVAAGAADPSPYRLGRRQNACQDCDLLPVCRYEAAVEGYRELEDVSMEVLGTGAAD